MLKFCLGIIVFLLSFNLTAQVNEKNKAFCRKIIESNKDVAVKTYFETNVELSPTQIEQLKTDLFEKNSVYKIELNEKNNILIVYHLSQVTYEDLKLLMLNIGVEFNYTKTEKFTNQFEKL